MKTPGRSLDGRRNSKEKRTQTLKPNCVQIADLPLTWSLFWAQKSTFLSSWAPQEIDSGVCVQEAYPLVQKVAPAGTTPVRSEGGRTGQRGVQPYIGAFADPTGSSARRLGLQKCPELGPGRRTCIALYQPVIGCGLPPRGKSCSFRVPGEG